MSFLTKLSSKKKELFIVKLLEYILEYQKKHNIKNQCITNVQYFRDSLYFSGHDVEVKAVICVRDINGTRFIYTGHLIICLDKDTYIDPSYEFQPVQNNTYFHSMDEFIKFTKNTTMSEIIDKEKLKKQMSNFLNFVKHANTINNNECIVASKNYYNKLADYVENQMDKLKKTSNINRTLANKSIIVIK